jgi:hypothetical protein
MGESFCLRIPKLTSGICGRDWADAYPGSARQGVGLLGVLEAVGRKSRRADGIDFYEGGFAPDLSRSLATTSCLDTKRRIFDDY